MGHINKDNRRTADKYLRTKIWRGTSIVLMKHRRYLLFSSQRKKFGHKKEKKTFWFKFYFFSRRNQDGKIADRPWDLDLNNIKQLFQIFMTVRIG
jgi:hypothetical protein